MDIPLKFRLDELVELPTGGVFPIIQIVGSFRLGTPTCELSESYFVNNFWYHPSDLIKLSLLSTVLPNGS
jgi:hypothetical protein